RRACSYPNAPRLGDTVRRGQAELGQLVQDLAEMRGRGATPPALKPVLLQEGEERRQTQMGLPEDAEERRALLLPHFRQLVDRAGRVGLVPAARFRSGAEAEI